MHTPSRHKNKVLPPCHVCLRVYLILYLLYYKYCTIITTNRCLRIQYALAFENHFPFASRYILISSLTKLPFPTVDSINFAPTLLSSHVKLPCRMHQLTSSKWKMFLSHILLCIIIRRKSNNLNCRDLDGGLQFYSSFSFISLIYSSNTKRSTTIIIAFISLPMVL